MKVLIISHLPVATQNNMGKTFLSLFSQFGREELCQLYIYPAIPDVDRCSSFYRVTDKDILRSIVSGKKAGGEVNRALIGSSQGLYEHAEDETFYRSRKNKSALRRILRDMMWKMGHWYNGNLTAWLEKEKPDCIFVAPGAAKFCYDFALEIAGKRDIPVVSYICDEYYFVRRPDEPLDRFRLKLLQRKMEKLMEESACVVTICDELKEAYGRRFGVKAVTLMTGTSWEIAAEPKIVTSPRSVCYFGNIRCNRYISLGQIGRELDRINEERGTDLKLKIYTSEKDPEILGTFRDIRSAELCGFVTGAEFEKVFSSAELLLHTEAFDEASIDFVQHSVSTKIADSLASGIPLLAYGPESVSSMKHLLRYNCALTALSEDELRPMLEKAFFDEGVRRSAAENALAAARECHGKDTAGIRLRVLLEKICGK